MPSRRAYLAALGTAGVGAFAGCVGGRPTLETTRTTTSTTTTQKTPDDPAHVPTRLPWGDAGTVDGTSVRPTAAWDQHAVLYLTSADQMAVGGFGDRQTCFVRVAVGADSDGPTPDVDDFSLEAAGETYIATTRLGVAAPYRIFPDEAAYGKDYPAQSGGGWFGFLVPPSLPDDASPTLSVQFGGETEGQLQWPLPDEAVASLRAPAPDFDVVSFDVPSAVAPSDPIEVSWGVANHGGPATFHAVVNEQGPRYRPHRSRTQIPANERATASVTIDTDGEWNADEVELGFRSVPRQTDWTVAVRSS